MAKKCNYCAKDIDTNDDYCSVECKQLNNINYDQVLSKPALELYVAIDNYACQPEDRIVAITMAADQITAIDKMVSDGVIAHEDIESGNIDVVVSTIKWIQ